MPGEANHESLRWRTGRASLLDFPGLGLCPTRRRNGDFQSERGALAQAVAVDEQGGADFPGGEGAGVEAEAVAVPAGGETVTEDAGEILGGNAHAVVDDGDVDPPVDAGNAHDDALVVASRVLAGVPGVAQQIDEDLEDFVLFDVDGWDFMIIADDVHSMQGQRIDVHAQTVFDQALNIDDFFDAGVIGVIRKRR